MSLKKKNMPGKLLKVLKTGKNNGKSVPEIIRDGKIKASYNTVQKYLYEMVINGEAYVCEETGERRFSCEPNSELKVGNKEEMVSNSKKREK